MGRLYLSGCLGKVAHSTREFARNAANELKRRERKRFNVYRCPRCNKWHVGSDKRRKYETM